MIRELLWVITAVAATLIWFLAKTWDQGPLMEDLVGQATLWTAVKIYAAVVVARVTWRVLGAVAAPR